MDEVRFRVVTASDPDLLQQRLERAMAELGRDAVFVDVKFDVAASGEHVVYAALIVYKRVEPWKD